MGTGYTRNDTSNNIADGNIINAADLDGEFDAIESAMGTSGHTHDGTSAEGGPVTVLGPVQDFVASATEIKPKTTNTLDIGTSGLLFKDMFLDGVATVGSIKIDNAGTIGSASDSDAIAISSDGVVSFSQNTIGKTGSGYVLSLQTSDTTIEATNVLGKIEFSAPDEASGTDAILVGASIEALAEDTFDSSTNSTALVFKTNTTGAATERMRLTSAGDLHFLDNRKAIFGAGSDLQIYHDGLNNYIDAANIGNLILQSQQQDKDIVLRSDDGSGGLADYVTIDGSTGQVKLRHYSDLKFNTTSTGIAVTGNATFADDGKAIFGAGSDLQIYHDGGDSIIADVGTGHLRLLAEDFRLQDASASETYITAAKDGAVSLRFNDSQKLATTDTGVDITGTLTADDITLSDADTPNITLTDTTNTLTTIIQSGNSTGIVGTTTNHDLRIQRNGADIIDVLSTGIDITGTLTSDGLTVDGNVGIGTSSPSSFTGYTNVTLKGGSNGSNLDFHNSSGTRVAAIISNPATELIVETNEATPLLFKTNSTERMRIDSSGNVGIGGTPTNASDHKSLALFGAANTGAGFIEFNDTSGNADGAIFADNGNLFINADYDNSTASSTIRFRVDGSSEKMRIDSSGNVGIGTDSPSRSLHISGGTNSMVIERTDATTSALLLVAESNNTAIYSRASNASTTARDLVFNMGSTEAMRIDSSGNLLVGMTSASTNNDGAGIRADGLIHAKRADVVATFNRKTTDGTVVQIAKDNTVVGSIGTSGVDLTIGTGDVGLKFNDASNRIDPWNVTTNTSVDGAFDLGKTDRRFKDLYLSGGVFLGGVGSSNKLDDYEEGTWTPALTGFTVGNGTATGFYTKVGNLVTLNFRVVFGSTSTQVGSMTSLTGFPFTVDSFVSGYVDILDAATIQYSAVASGYTSASSCSIRGLRSSGTYVDTYIINATTPITWTTSDSIMGQLTYRAG